MNTTKIISSALIASPFLASCVTLAQAPQQQKKNILFIAVDDLKPLLGCYGDPLAKTPNIDKLASRGAIYTHSYCQQAVSGPTRASLLTGKCPDYTQVWDLKTMIRNINPTIVTLPQYLVENGYNTAGIGKIFDPRSVDANQDKVSWSTPYIEYEHFLDNSTGDIMLASYRNPALRAEITKYEAEGTANGLKGNKLRLFITEKVKPSTECLEITDEAYNDGAIAKGAIDFLENRKDDKPFFLAVGFKKPHLPFVAPKKYWDLYKRGDMPLAEYRKKALNSPEFAYTNSSELKSYTDIPAVYEFTDIDNTILTEDKARELIHGYYASVSYMDAQVGKVLAELERKGLTKNTIIVLWGDHGWHLGDHGLWNKHTNFEQAARTPMIIVDPSVNKSVVVNSPVEFLDIFPTLCDLSGVEIPTNLDGKSLKATLQKPDTKMKDYAVSQFPRGPRMGYSIRTEKYRYTVWVNWKDKVLDMNKIIVTELYDYEKDPLETENLVDKKEYAAVLKTMQAHFDDFKAKRIR
jgi:arylsulfatase A-like enzyme